MKLEHTLKTLEKAMTADYKEHNIDYYTASHEELLLITEELKQLKQGWLEASKEHPFQHCRVCTIEYINKLLGLDLDAEKEVEEYDEWKKEHETWLRKLITWCEDRYPDDCECGNCTEFRIYRRKLLGAEEKKKELPK